MRKLKISLVTFIIILITTATTTYAWISMATVNTLKDISLNAVSGYDLEMSLDGITYYDSIPKELIEEEIKNLSFNNVTSTDGINFNSHYSETMMSIKNKDYLSLTFHFRTSSRYTEIHLSDNLLNVDYEDEGIIGTYITSKGKTFKSNYEFLYDVDEYVLAGEERKYYAKDAMRVSFVNLEDDSSKIFDLSGDEHRGFGKEYGAHSYYEAVTNKVLNIPKAPNTIYELSEFSNKVPKALTHTSHIVTLRETIEKAPNNRNYSTGSVTMNVWLEGFDADAFDSLYKDQLKMQFMFKAVMPEDFIV